MIIKSESKNARDLDKHPRHLGRGIAGLAMAAALTGVIATPAFATPADSSTQSTAAHVQVDEGITMTGLTSSFLLTGTPGATVTAPNAVTYNVETNNVAGYGVTVQSQDNTMLPPVPATNPDSIPIADLTVRESGIGTFNPVSDTSTESVHSQGGRSENGGDDLSTDFKIRIPVVSSDTYTATLDYVATTL